MVFDDEEGAGDAAVRTCYVVLSCSLDFGSVAFR